MIMEALQDDNDLAYTYLEAAYGILGGIVVSVALAN
jgi:hypothetical protein